MNEEKPAWLKRMENGSIGEATAKEFLIDRFWILERSVDIHGADLIIQRRLTSQNLLDKNPPRFGVIQVKYFQDENTSQYISKEYILDNEGKGRKEFFILAINGYEDLKKMYLISAKDIVSDFNLIDDSTKSNFDTYKIGGRELLRSEKYLIKHKKTALDKIENSLNLSSFSDNRRFLSYLIPEINKEIDTPYIINIANDQADFKVWQNELKTKVDSAIYDLQQIAEKLNGILRSTNPAEIEEIIDDLEIDNRGNLIVSLDIDSNFFEEARGYKYKHDFLESNNFLQNFLVSQDDLIQKIKTMTFSSNKITEQQALIVDVKFDDKLNKVEFLIRVDTTDKIASVEKKLYNGFFNENQFEFSYYFVPANFSFTELKNSGNFKWKNIQESLSNGRIPNDIMNKIYEILHEL